MNDKRRSHDGKDDVFATSIRTMKADEIDLVGGGDPFEQQNYLKDPGGVDNHSRSMD
jgi:hypothetical protein